MRARVCVFVYAALTVLFLPIKIREANSSLGYYLVLGPGSGPLCSRRCL